MELFVKLLKYNNICGNSKRDMSLKHVAYINLLQKTISFKGVVATRTSKTTKSKSAVSYMYSNLKDRYEVQYCIQYYKEWACMANQTLTSKL